MDAPLSGSSVAEALGNAFRLNSDRQRYGQDAFTASPFSRLLVTHVLSLAGDALVTLALAGSLFFSTPLHAARGKVALTLLLTIAPFAIVAPLLGPIIDKTQGGRRTMVVATALGRVVACFLMARYIDHSYLLYPAAFLALVCSKGYSVAKSTLVPSAVQRPQDLVEANSKLAVSGALAGFLMAIPGVAILKLASAPWVLRVDILLFLACALTALRLQVTERREIVAGGQAPDPVIVEEGTFGSAAARRRAKPLPAGGIQVAAFAMGVLRSIVGFLTFLVAFAFRIVHINPVTHIKTGTALWWYGVVLACSIGGNLIGAAVAPWLRSRLREELILATSAITIAFAGILAVFFQALGGRPAAALLAGVVGLAAGAAKLAFDALVQRHVPAATQGRAFGRFEAGFQLVWVLGGLVPVVIPMSLRTGFLIVTLAAAVAGSAFVVGTRMARLGQLPPWWPGVRPAVRRRSGPPAAPSVPARGATMPFGGPLAADSPTVPGAAAMPFGGPLAPDSPTVPGSDTTPWVKFLATPPDLGAAAPPGAAPDSAAEPEAEPEAAPDPAADPEAGQRLDLGTYPPLIPGPPALGRSGRPIPPPLTGPPPLAAPLAPRPPRNPPPAPPDE